MGEALRRHRLAPLVVHRLDQVLLGPARRPEREEHAQPQVPDAGDRRVARAPGSSITSTSCSATAPIPTRRIEETVYAMHDMITRGQGALLGHVGMERGRDHGRVADRRAASPAQAGDGAAAVQPVPSRARREGVRAALRRHRPRHDDLEPARVGPADRQVQRRHPAGLARHASRATSGSPSGSPTPARSRRCARSRRSRSDLGCTLAQMSLAWCLKNPHVSTVITGASRPAQVVENMKALDVVPKLTPTCMARIDAIAAARRMTGQAAWTAPVAIVTAASKGMGAACARELAARGYRVSLMARGRATSRRSRANLAAARRAAASTSPTDLERFVARYARRVRPHRRRRQQHRPPAEGPAARHSPTPTGTRVSTSCCSTSCAWRASVTPALRARRAARFVNISTFAAYEPDAALPDLVLPARRARQLLQALRGPGSDAGRSG